MTMSTSPPSSALLSRGWRRAALSRHPTQRGIDFVEVADRLPDGLVLLVHFVRKLGVSPRDAIPPGLTAGDISVHELWGPGRALPVVSVSYPDDDRTILTVQVRRPDDFDEVDDFATYVLELRPGAGQSIDPFFARATFTISVDAPLDVAFPEANGRVGKSEVEINYLAKDDASFRRLMLDHLSLLVPEWKERHPADFGIALVELLAYAGDYLSYYQDAVATEAYLGTARRRISVRRHARLLDYDVHDGCNARVWVHFQVDAPTVTVPAGTPLLTRLPRQPRRLPTLAYLSLENPQRLGVFETVHPANFFQEHNRLRFHAWGFPDYSLEPGATSATLTGHLRHLKTGDVLLFEEVIGPATGLAGDANRAHRHAVRLAQPPILTVDALLDREVTEITWLAEDALPFSLPVAGHTADGRHLTDLSVALGNVVLADSGRTIRDEALPEVLEEELYTPTLRFSDLTYRVSDDETPPSTIAASAALTQDPRAATPAIRLDEGPVGASNEWIARRDLLTSDQFAREFVVETDNDGMARLRFGDGVLGKRPNPGTRFRATYRVHNGQEGNVGPEAISHVVSDDGRIVAVRNPMPARGGIQPESTDSARLNAPQAFPTQESCVTPNDYAAAAERHPEVQKAVARKDWTGSWRAVRIYVDRIEHRPVDASFQEALRAFLEPYRLAGCELDVVAPYFVPLSIQLTVWLEPDALRNLARRRLLDTFSDSDLPDGRRGFFHPANFSFGCPVYLSPIVAAARQTTGVVDVRVDEFHPMGEPPRDEIAAGRIEIGPLQIARLDNSARQPENGIIRFRLEGGQ